MTAVYYKKSDCIDSNCFIDDYIPFVPNSIYLYTFGDLFIMSFIIPTSHNASHLLHIIFGLLLVTACQCLVFIYVPSTLPDFYRTELDRYERRCGKVHTWTRQFYDKMHMMDGNLTVLPSGHCSIATYLAMTQFHLFGWWTMLNPLFIALSCVMTKQHSFVDVVLGIVFGFCIFGLVDYTMHIL